MTSLVVIKSHKSSSPMIRTSNANLKAGLFVQTISAGCFYAIQNVVIFCTLTQYHKSHPEWNYFSQRILLPLFKILHWQDFT